MLNILIPIAGKSRFFDHEKFPFPKPLIEICGIPMIEYPIKNLGRISVDKRFLFIATKEDCLNYHLDNTLRLLTDSSTVIIQQSSDAKGAACSCLLAIEEINTDAPLIISNGDQIIDVDFDNILKEFDEKNVDAAVLVFESVHPQWSYVQFEKDDLINETAEKNPISNHAIAGFYYFKHGRDFVAAAQESILRGVQVNGIFYIAPTFNELILQGKKVIAKKIPKESYHSFYSIERIRDFESKRPALNSF